MMPQYPYNFSQPMSFGTMSQNIQYVNGLKSAQAYQMGANSEVILMDNNEPVFYHKSTDAAGMPSIKVYEFHEKTVESPEQKGIEEIKNRIARLEFLVESIKEGDKHESNSSDISKQNTDKSKKSVRTVQKDGQWRSTDNGAESD